MSRLIGQSLPNDAAQRAGRTLYIVHTQRDPLVVAEIELSKIPLQVFLADVMIDAIDAPLQDREISFDGVSVRITAHIFLRRALKNAARMLV
jgi:hypothetical protein